MSTNSSATELVAPGQTGVAGGRSGRRRISRRRRRRPRRASARPGTLLPRGPGERRHRRGRAGDGSPAAPTRHVHPRVRGRPAARHV